MSVADDLWHECASWLTRCKVIPPDHKANLPDSEIKVLAFALRDGVLLCNLLNFIDPIALDMKDFNRKPQMAQFLCFQNIKLFLDTCKNHFGIREGDLFEPMMLYNLSNFHRVLITLSKLSKRVAQIHSNITGFSSSTSQPERSHSDEDIYKDLHSTNNNNHNSIGPTTVVVAAIDADAKPHEASTESSETNPLLAQDDDGEGSSFERGDSNETADDNSGDSNAAADECGANSLSSIIDNDQLAVQWENFVNENHYVLSRDDEKIYEDLCYVTFSSSLPKNTKEEEVYQDLCAIQRASRSQITSSSNLEQRDFVIRELVETEANYLEVLQALREKFMLPLEKHLSRDEVNCIFHKIKELIEVHERFLQKLKEVIANSRYKLSQVFLEFRESFLIYGDYCANMTGATDTLREVTKKNSLVDQLVQQCQKEHSDGRVQLRDILSVPMQRILKYHLLLDKLVHETSPTHEDYRGLERAKEAMVDVAQFTNEVKRDSEHLVVIQKVRESIVDLNLPNGNDLTQYGRLLLDGDLNIKAHEDQKTKHRYAFIFEKIMILVKNSKLGDNGQYSFRESHNLAEYRVEQCHSRRTLGRDARFKFQLLLARKTQSTAFTLYMKTEAERNKWKKSLQEAMDNLEPFGCRNTDHKFQITTFDTAVICRHCSKFLKGRIHQGYRCKVCEICVHKGCISSTGRCKPVGMNLAPPVCDRQLSEYYWFVGPMDRDSATMKLENRKVGTYLLRVRPQGASHPNETMYALSLKTDERIIKHMKINQKVENDSTLYYLSTRRHFKTIVELVSFYERNDLGENFAGLNQSLSWPYREVVATAVYDFNPVEASQLALRQGCQVLIIGKEGDSRGWWRGKTMDKVGFFPKEYVREYPQSPDDL